jgi:hypothetical protein
LNRAELYEEIAGLARDEGITDQAEWNELCDEVVDSHSEIGELSDDQNLEGLKEALHMAWAEYQRESGPESANAIAEDPTSPHV